MRAWWGGDGEEGEGGGGGRGAKQHTFERACIGNGGGIRIRVPHEVCQRARGVAVCDEEEEGGDWRVSEGRAKRKGGGDVDRRRRSRLTSLCAGLAQPR